MFHEVVAAIDGSPASFRAAAMGARLVAEDGGEIELVAVKPPRSELASRLHRGDEAEELAGDRSAADLRSAAVVIGDKAPIRAAEILEGPVAETILGHCGAPSGDRLLALGSGRHRVRLGSVSSTVLRHATCPVLVVREGASRGPGLQRILVGFDATAGAWAAVDAAAALAARTGAEVHLVEVLKPSFPLPPEGLPLTVAEMQQLAGEPERREMEEAARRIVAAGGKVARSSFDLGKAPDRLLALAEDADVDLIVVGARGHHAPGMRRLLGGVSDQLVARSMRPVLVVR